MSAPFAAPHVPGAAALKVCGATTLDDVELLAAAGADYIGLWHGVPGGHADLSLEAITSLAAAAYESGVEPVLVTFIGAVDTLRGVLDRTGIRHLQLHAYQSPTVVRALRGAVPGGLRIFKVLHLRAGRCLEQRFIASYERAGTDAFLLDTVTDDGRIGSTGQQLAAADIVDLLPALTRPFLLAGGISAANRASYDAVVADPRFFGIDVDTAARDDHGAFVPHQVTELTRSWHTGRYEEMTA